MNNESDFIPTACSTVSRKKQRKFKDKIDFEEADSFFTVNNSLPRDKSLSEASYHLEEQRSLAKKSLQRANKVSAIPSKYLRANFSNSDNTTSICNESSISDSDLLQTPRNASTPRNSIPTHSILSESLAQLSCKIAGSDFNIDNIDSLVCSFQKSMKTADEQGSMFKPGEEAASMLMADELSWRRKNEIPVQDEPFSQIDNIERQSVGDFFQQRCDTISGFPGGESPDITKEPIPLIDPSMSSNNISDEHHIEDILEQNKQKKSLSISMIQKCLADSNFTPRRAADNIFKLGEYFDESLPLENKTSSSLSISKNSSYTSDHSENNAIQQISNKENINSLNIKTASTELLSSRASSRASTVLTSLQNGKLPIETTKCDLIWGCVKVGKSVTQEFIIRNRSSKRLGVQLSLSSQEYKIRKDNRTDSEPLSSNKILLHPHESKAIIVSFIPTKTGAAVGELLFTSLDQQLKQSGKQLVRLYGYGGSFKVDFLNLTRDTTGKFWLSLGKLDDRNVITSSFKVKNKGDIPIFIYISIQSLDACKLEVSPNFFVLMSQIQKEVVISYRPSNEDYNFLHKTLQSPVVDLGNLNVTFGSEVDRGRLRRLCEKCTEYTVDPLTNIITNKIDGEMMPLDLVKFKESPASFKEILKLFNHHQIVITLERDPEQTIIQQYTDDSGLYQSLYQDTTLTCNKTSMINSCHIAPAIIFLTLPYKYKDTVFLKSDNEKKLHFKVSYPNELEVKPKKGTLEAHGTVVLNIEYPSNGTVNEKKCLKVLVMIENELFEIDVKVESLGLAMNKKKSLLNCI